jgi:hypothetical protein
MAAIIRNADLKVSTKNQQTITTKLLTEFDKIAYVSGPLSQWVRLSYFSSMLQKYIRKVSIGLQVVWLCSSRPQEPNTTDDTENG